MGTKGSEAVHEVKSAEQFSANSQYEAISKSLDEICATAVRANHPPSYNQIIFTESWK